MNYNYYYLQLPGEGGLRLDVRTPHPIPPVGDIIEVVFSDGKPMQYKVLAITHIVRIQPNEVSGRQALGEMPVVFLDFFNSDEPLCLHCSRRAMPGLHYCAEHAAKKLNALKGSG